SARTGPSRTPCTGSWTWSFATTNAASEQTMPQPTSRPAGTSPTISPERAQARIPSASGAKPQDGTTSISPASSPHEILHPIPLTARSRLLRLPGQYTRLRDMMVDACMLPSTRKRRRWQAGALEDAPGRLRCDEHDCYWHFSDVSDHAADVGSR